MITAVFLAAAWGALGHQAMARATLELLSPRARTEIRRLLGSDDAFVSASIWADRIRRTNPRTGPWHYVNIPIDHAGYDRARHCPDGDCVIEAIRHFDRVLRDGTGPTTARTEALKYLVHFVADLHQPLHVGGRRDRGGNDRTVTFFDQEHNLHWVWDTGLLDHAGWTEDRLATELERRGRALPATQIDLEAWAAESFAAARDHGYPPDPAGHIDDAFAGPAAELAVAQLARSVLRLAALLNRALDPAAASPSQ